jgi:UDP-N-acetylmuramoylalanine--D-glutamate ligase
MLRWQKPGDSAVLNCDDTEVAAWSTQGERLGFGFRDTGLKGVFDVGDGLARVRFEDREETLPISDWLKLPGQHNRSNAMAAICASLKFGATADAVQLGLESYRPLPHRLQWVADVDGRSFFNDSLATTPESAQVALDAFQSPIVLLAGGYDKRVDLSHFAAAIAKKARAVALMGQTAGVLREMISRDPESKCLISGDFSSFSEAVEWAVSHSLPGDVVLLSPGCASYDWFRNFADRGEQFIELAKNLARKKP